MMKKIRLIIDDDTIIDLDRLGFKAETIISYDRSIMSLLFAIGNFLGNEDFEEYIDEN